MPPSAAPLLDTNPLFFSVIHIIFKVIFSRISDRSARAVVESSGRASFEDLVDVGTISRPFLGKQTISLSVVAPADIASLHWPRICAYDAHNTVESPK